MDKPLILWQAHEGHISGANIALLEYVDALSNDYLFHIILPHSGSLCQELEQRFIPFTIIPQYSWAETEMPTFGKRLKLFVRTSIAVQKTVSLIRRINPAFVFTNTQTPFVAAKAAYKTKCPHVWWIHEFGEEDFGFSIGWGNRSKAYRLMQQWSGLIVCNSKAVAAKFRQLLPGSKIRVTYQPVSWDNLKIGTEKNGKFLMFGQLAPAKGHLDVIDAMQQCLRQHKYPGSLHIIGPCEDTAYYDLLVNKVKEAGLQDLVKIKTGFFEKEYIIPQFDVLLVASRAEAFGRVIVEACKAGLKVVVKNSGGAPELINDSNGVLYNNQEELMAILCGEKQLPQGPVTLNYEEQQELEQLKTCLAEIA